MQQEERLGRLWKTYWRTMIALSRAFGCGSRALFLLLNVGGWRARVAAVIGSVYNWPVVVAAAGEFPAAGAARVQSVSFCERFRSSLVGSPWLPTAMCSSPIPVLAK